MPYTRVEDAIRVCGFEDHRQPVGVNVAIRIEGWIGGLSSSQVVQIGTDRKNDLPELRGPTGLFGSAGHEPGMVMDGFEESGFEGISDIENAIAAIGEAAWPVRSEERRVGKECGSTCRSRGSP